MCFSGGEQVFLSSCICKDLAATTLINRHLLRVSMLVTLSLYSFFLLSYVCRAQAHKLLLKILCSSPTQARRPPSAHRSVFARISHHSLTYPQSIHIYAIISTLSTPKLEKKRIKKEHSHHFRLFLVVCVLVHFLLTFRFTSTSLTRLSL